MKYQMIITLWLAFISNTTDAQDVSFSQFNSNPVQLNPALAGANHGCPRINFNFRRQVSNSSTNYVSRIVSTDWFARKLHSGFAIQLKNDIQGNQVFINNTISFTYSYHQKLSEKISLLFGVETGGQQNYLDWNKLTFGDMIDPIGGFIFTPGELPSGRLLENGMSTKGLFDINSGIAIVSERLTVGFAVKHLNRPNYSLLNAMSRLPMLFVGHITSNHILNDKISLRPSAMYSFQSGFQSVIIGFNSKYKIFTLGAWAREVDAIILSLGIEKPRFRIQYSYDLNVNPQLIQLNSQAHEGSLMLFF